ncbi:MAG TPA: alpha/beta hydrolase [Actinomycetota bacterium]|nr:alpha/beta hydrolase [Actinomycetota bacterium]
MRRRILDVGGRTTVGDFGGQGPVVVLLHGLGGSHVNWMRLGPMLAERARVLAPDLPGFGFTPPDGRSTTVQANARWVLRFLREVAGTPAILVGNSMGGLVSILAAGAYPEDVAGLILLDPALPLAPREPRDRQVLLSFTAYMVPGVGEAFVRRRARTLGPEGLVRETFRLCCVHPSRVPDEVIAAHAEVVAARMRMPWADRSMLRAARSMLRMLFRRRQFRAVLERVRAPTLLINGAGDRLVKLAAARVASEVRPDWTLRPLDDVGHVPQLEAPERTADEIRSWLEGPGKAVVERAAEVEAAAAER